MPVKYVRNVVNILLFLLGAVLLFVLTPKLLVFFMPFVLGWMIAMIANPLVRLLEKKLKIVRKHGSMLIIILAIGLIILLGYWLVAWIVREVSGFVSILPELYGAIAQDLEETGENLQGLSSRFSPQMSKNIAELTNSLISYLGEVISAVGKPTVAAAGSFAKNIPGALIHVIFTILSAYFFIAERERILQAGREKIPLSIRQKWTFIYGNFKQAVGGYFKAQFKIMGVVALILFVGFLILRINYAILLAAVIALLDFLPFFGTGTALLPWAVLKVLSGDYQFAVGLIIIYLVSQLVRQVIQPKIVGDTIGLDPLSTLVFMYIGYKISNIFGMIIAVPIGMILVSLFKAGAFDDVVMDVKELAEGLNSFRRGTAELSAKEKESNEERKDDARRK